MRWQFSARLTSLIVLAVVSLAVAGAALGLALARGGSAGTPRQVSSHVDDGRAEARGDGAHTADKRMDKRGERDADRYQRGNKGRGTYHHWWGARRVIVVPRFEAFPGRFFRSDHLIVRGSGRGQPERQVTRPGGMVIAVGEVTAVREDAIKMHTVLGNDITIDVSQLSADVLPEVGASAIVIAERDDDRYIAQSLDLLSARLSGMLERMRAPPRSAS